MNERRICGCCGRMITVYVSGIVANHKNQDYDVQCSGSGIMWSLARIKQAR
jgi:hypothetical protein